MSVVMQRSAGLRASSAAVTRPCCIARIPLGVRASASPISTTFAGGNGSGSVSFQQPQATATLKIPDPLPGILVPPANYNALAQAAGKKAALPTLHTFISGVLAGCFIAFGGVLMCSVQAGMQSLVPTVPGLVKLLGGLLFPVGLTLVVMSGAELYTGNTAVLPIGAYEKKASISGLLHNWFWSYLGNLIGSLAIVALVATSGVLDGNSVAVKIAEAKSSLPFVTALTRSILANWLVCLAVWNASAATSVAGKILALWMPICTFVTVGLEHSVANMFLIPMGMALGAKVTWSQFFLNNLLPVTLGNTLAGLVLVATAFAILYGSLGKPAAAK